MSATLNDNAAKAVSNQEGEVGSHVPRTGPQTTHGHQPGQIVGNDNIPTSHVQTLPPGTAPAQNTFAPNTQASSVPGQADNPESVNPETEGQGATAALDTFPGATSGTMNTGLGKPMQGETSAEKHHDGQAHRKHQGQGLQGVGASEAGHFDQQGSTGKRVP
ncbi:MAG: hypothetical protein Q9162_004092 [Coniocarpon cinnabarinum]